MNLTRSRLGSFISLNTTTALHERFEWLDDARGLVVLMLIISMVTGALSGDLVAGDPPLGPTYLNHGYQYYAGTPAIITGTDIGQPIFMFMMGFVGYIAFTSRLRKRGFAAAWSYALRRFVLLYAFGLLDDGLLHYVERGTPAWRNVLFDGTFSKLALGALAAFLCVSLVRSADRRLLVGLVILAVHAVLYTFPVFDHYTWSDDILALPFFPFGLVSHLAIAIIGTCFAQWYFLDPADPKAGFKRRIFPATAWAGVGAYCLDWLMPGEHHDVPASLALLAVAAAGLILVGFYGGYSMGLRFPFLSALGKNLLLMFALSWFVVDWYLQHLPKPLLIEYPFLALLLAGLLPIAVLTALAVLLERKNIVIRA